MPHQCTACGHTFEDGSKEMLSGCPDCGGNKFQFTPSGTTVDPADSPTDDSGDEQSSSRERSPPRPSRSPASESGPSESESDPSESEPPGRNRPKPGTSSVTETVGRATTHLRDLVSSGPESSAASDDTQPSDPPDPEAEWPDGWDNASDDRNEGDSPPTNDPPSRRNEGVATDNRIDTGSRLATDADTPDSTPESTSDEGIIDADARRDDVQPSDRGEDLAQASARSDVVSPSELDDNSTAAPTDPSGASVRTPDGSAPTRTDNPESFQTDDGESPTDGEDGERPTDGEVVSEPTGEEPDLADLREQLNDQFESIKILEPGQYELNLMELYDREEYIIALQENGRYVIQVPEQWMGEDPDDR